MADFGISEWNGEKVFTSATEVNLATMKKAAFMVEADVKKSFTLQGTYERYPRGKNRAHWSSAPGEPPAVDTGVLRASQMSEVVVEGSNIIGRVGPDIEYIASKITGGGTDVEYGLYQELGTNMMQPRPFLRPALRRNENKIEKMFQDANK